MRAKPETAPRTRRARPTADARTIDVDAARKIEQLDVDCRSAPDQRRGRDAGFPNRDPECRVRGGNCGDWKFERLCPFSYDSAFKIPMGRSVITLAAGGKISAGEICRSWRPFFFDELFG